MIDHHKTTRSDWLSGVRPYLPSAKVVLVGLALVAIGLSIPSIAGAFGVSPDSSLVKHLGDAIAIAGFLALFVDPVLQKELTEHAKHITTEDVFERALGFPLPDEITSRLKQWFQVNQVSRRQRIRYRFERLVAEPSRLRVHIEHEYELENLAYFPQKVTPARHHALVEAAFLKSFECVLPNGTAFRDGDGTVNLLRPSETPGEQGRLTWRYEHKDLRLPPRRSRSQPADAAKFRLTWYIETELNGQEFHASWTTPAIGIEIREDGAAGVSEFLCSRRIVEFVFA